MVLLLGLFAQLALADSLFARGYHEAARVEYERAFFFNPASRQAIEPRMNHARTLFAENEAKGTEAFSRIVGDFPGLDADAVRAIALYYMRGGRYFLAADLLRDGGDKKMLGLACLLDGRLAVARDIFMESGNREIAGEIDDFLSRPKRSERTALVLSLFLPGAGQVYAGDLKSAFRDLGVNLGSDYLLYNALEQNKYIDAGIVFFFLVNRFYIGSLNNAQKAAREYNEKTLREWQHNIIESYFTDLEPYLK